MVGLPILELPILEFPSVTNPSGNARKPRRFDTVKGHKEIFMSALHPIACPAIGTREGAG
jgi:hypothetical protein